MLLLTVLVVLLLLGFFLPPAPPRPQVLEADERLQREKGLQSGAAAPLNLEYLKNVVVNFMCAAHPSEQTRLLPVIASLLRLSGAEVGRVQQRLAEEERAATNSGAVSGLLKAFW